MAGGGGGEGGGAGPKHDDLTPHPVKDQLPGVSYCITSPPPWRESPIPIPSLPPRLRPSGQLAVALGRLMASFSRSQVASAGSRATSLLGNNNKLRGAAHNFEGVCFGPGW